MGLDLIVEGCAKPGHEAEWRGLLERAFAGGVMTEPETARFQEISIPAYERIGAPQVGSDRAADAWIIETRQATTPEAVAAVLKDFEGHYALRLVVCDGIPKYSHGGLYDGLDETSFRGEFLRACGDILSEDLIDRAWGDKLPAAALDYGRALLAAAEAEPKPKPSRPKPGLLSRLGLTRKEPEPIPLQEQQQIVRSAGRWFVFWGERGHAIRAWC